MLKTDFITLLRPVNECYEKRIKTVFFFSHMSSVNYLVIAMIYLFTWWTRNKKTN